ncbi:ECF transporter S component [Agathobacter sp.]
MKIKTKQITVTAIMLAICILSQFFKNLSVYITGPIINAALILTVVYAGLACGIILSIITPITSFFITGSPIMAAIPAMFPCIMIGNILLAVAVGLLRKKIGKTAGLPVSIVIGAVLKAAFMGILISLIVLPAFLPAKMQPMMHALQLQFSLTQLITAIIGGVYAVIIATVLNKTSLAEE